MQCQRKTPIMATIKRELSTKVNGNGKSEIILRLTVGRGLQPRLKSGLFINPSRYKDGKIIIPRANQIEAQELQELESRLIAEERHMLDFCESAPRESLDKEVLVAELDRLIHPEQYVQPEVEVPTFFETFEEYLSKQEFCKNRQLQFWCLLRSLRRFEVYTAKTIEPSFKLNLDTLANSDIDGFVDFMNIEPEIYEQMPELYKDDPADTHKHRKTHKPVVKGHNTIVSILRRLRAFINWCIAQGYTSNNPFDKFKSLNSERYGTPYYITVAERNAIADFDLSAKPELETQRDIFIFQCLIGCRVSDLLHLTKDSVIEGAIEYIPHKTSGERPEVIRVPLHKRAEAIIEKYRGRKDGKLLPFISSQKYNDAIKEVFKECGITRKVTVLNPTTGKEEKRPLNEVASSHLARRTFIGNIYKQVKDPNLVGKLSGHKEGSRAFTRYRDIDEDLMKQTISLLGD